jgi:hypothetical protein
MKEIILLDKPDTIGLQSEDSKRKLMFIGKKIINSKK